MLWSASNFFCGAAVVNRLLVSIGNTMEARDEDGGWDGRRDFFRFLCPPWPCWWIDGGEGELNKLSAPPTTIPGITIGVRSTWLVIWGDPTGGTNSSSGFKPAPMGTRQMWNWVTKSVSQSACLPVCRFVNTTDFLSMAFLHSLRFTDVIK